MRDFPVIIALFVVAIAYAAVAAPPPIAAVPAARQANTVAILPVTGEIDSITLRSLERRIREASRAGASAVVLDIDTPGGEMLATLDICHLIRTEAPANTVAWVNPKAFSAGTIIALACREILVHPEGVFGDAAPIQGIPIVGLRQMPVAERAKIEAPLLSEVVSSARRRGIDEKLVQAFVAVTLELWLIEEIETGARMFVDAGEYEIAFGEPPPRIRERGDALPAVETALDSTAFPTETAAPDETPPFLLDDPNADDSPRRLLTPADRGRWRLLGQVIGDEELLVVRADEAIAYELASGTAANDDEIAAFFGATSVIRIERSWSESMVRFLISWPVRLVLIVVLLVCFFIELAAPGVGVFGIAAGVALLLLLGAPAVAGMAQWWEILLVLLGFGLIAVELFALPGIGVAGIAGVICLFVGIVGTFIGGGGGGGGVWQDQLVTGLATTLAAVFAAGVAIWIVARQLGTIRGFDRLVLGASLAKAGGPPIGRIAPTADRDLGSTDGIPTEGSEGVALSPLRPSGRAEFDGRTFDVRSVGDFVESGARVRLLGIEGSSLLVEHAE